MESWAVILTLGASFVLVMNVQCNEDIVSVINRIDGLEEWTWNKINTAKISLRSEFKKYLNRYVAEAMQEIIQGESIEEMLRSQVLSEVRQLRRGNHQMKRQLHQVLTSYRDLQEELNTYRETLLKADKNASDMKTCSKFIVDSEMLRRDLEQCNGNVEGYRKLSEKKDQQILEMGDSLNILNQTPISSATAVTSTPESTTTSTSVVPSVTATKAKPEEERSRILVAALAAYTHHQFRQIDIDSNSVTTYTLRRLKKVTCVAYVSQLRKLLIGLTEPNKIISSNLDSNDVITMREHKLTSGMVVDEDRELVFMTTAAPLKTIGRMTTRGKQFTTITDLSSYGGYPRAIAVNTKEKKIYACNQRKVFTVTYEGRQLQTLATGSNMVALTLDHTGNTLYYNDKKKLMSLSQNVTREVTTLSNNPWNIKYYKDTVYFSSYGSSPAVGAVDVANDTVMYTLQQNLIKDEFSYIICLVP